MKNKETLEEAAERLYPIILKDDGWDKNKQYRDEWIEGAKWQQERMYSEEEVFELCKQFATFIQQKRPSYKKQLEWFEQFKNK